MKRKVLPILSAAAFAAFSMSSNVQAGWTDPCSYDGFYIGISEGFAGTFGDFEGGATFSSIDCVTGEVTDLLPLQNKAKLGQSRNITSADLGFSWVFCNWLYLGLELGASYAPGQMRDTFSATPAFLPVGLFLPDPSTQLSPFPQQITIPNATLAVCETAQLGPWEGSIDFTPGIMWCDTLFYARVGVAGNRIKLKTSVDFTIPVSEDLMNFPFDTVSTANIYGANSKNKHALRLGFGLSTYISENLSVNVNYIFTRYGKVRTFICPTNVTEILQTSVAQTTGAAPITLPPLYLSSDASIRIKRQTFTIGLNYYFDSLFCNIFCGGC